MSELEAIPDMTMKSHKMDIIFCGIGKTGHEPVADTKIFSKVWAIDWEGLE